MFAPLYKPKAGNQVDIQSQLTSTRYNNMQVLGQHFLIKNLLFYFYLQVFVFALLVAVAAAAEIYPKPAYPAPAYPKPEPVPSR